MMFEQRDVNASVFFSIISFIWIFIDYFELMSQVEENNYLSDIHNSLEYETELTSIWWKFV